MVKLRSVLLPFLIGFAVLFGLVLVVLHYILRPLKAVQKQAEAISNKQYLIQTQMPWTLELRDVVSAMNLMSAKIRDIFSEQEASLERIRNAAYTDSTTGITQSYLFQYAITSHDRIRDGFRTWAC